MIPSVSAEDREKFEKIESRKQQSKGKALFQRRKEREREEEEEEKCNEEEEERLAPVELLPGVDMDEMRMTVRGNILAVVTTVFFSGDDEATSRTLAWGRSGGD